MATSRTKVVRFHAVGDADVLQLDEIIEREPRKNEVRIRVEAIGLNRAEVMFRRGEYLEDPQLPSRIGYEAAGTIEAIGEEVEGLAIGERVSTIPSFSMGEYGVYGETAVVPAYAVANYPENLSPSQGAAIWMQYITAWGALTHYGNLQAEQTVLITAASSSVGLAAIQLAKSAGARVIAVTRNNNKRPFLLDAGADYVVVTDEQDLEESVDAITSDTGVDLIFDPISGPILESLANVAGYGATIFQYGALASEQASFPLFAALAKGLVIRGYTLFEIVRRPKILAQAKQAIYQELEAGNFVPFIDRTFPLEQIAAAHEYMESNRQIGKIIVTV